MSLRPKEHAIVERILDLPCVNAIPTRLRFLKEEHTITGVGLLPLEIAFVYRPCLQPINHSLPDLWAETRQKSVFDPEYSYFT